MDRGHPGHAPAPSLPSFADYGCYRASRESYTTARRRSPPSASERCAGPRTRRRARVSRKRLRLASVVRGYTGLVEGATTGRYLSSTSARKRAAVAALMQDNARDASA